MKIGLVTVTNYNFGSILQSFALQEILLSYGHEVQIIKYKERIGDKWKRLQNKEYVVTRSKYLFKSISSKFLRSNHLHLNFQLRKQAFAEFVNNSFQFSVSCKSHKDLSNLARTYDVVLLGSDQVWHPMNLSMDFFTLNFVPDGIKKVAYAPSFGVSELPYNTRKAYQSYILRFESLSSRESTGTKLIKDLTGRNAKLVCDPTLLLDKSKWEKLSGEDIKINEKYVLCYFIGNNPNQRETAADFAKRKGLKMVSLLHIDEYIPSDENYADITPYDVGPLDFLNLIKNAQYVATDSFHATVFSLIFHINFFTFNRFENNIRNSTTSRIDNLLELINLPERKIVANADVEQLEKLGQIEFQNVDARLKDFRLSSLEYLMNALKA